MTLKFTFHSSRKAIYETAHDRIPVRNTLLYNNQQKWQMRLKKQKNTFLSSSGGSGLIWVQTVYKGCQQMGLYLDLVTDGCGQKWALKK